MVPTPANVAAIDPTTCGATSALAQKTPAAKTVDIELLDHVIVGRSGADPSGRGHFSFREAGLL